MTNRTEHDDTLTFPDVLAAPSSPAAPFDVEAYEQLCADALRRAREQPDFEALRLRTTLHTPFAL